MTGHQTYPLRVRGCILPLSVADSLPEAFEEWLFTGQTEDFLKPSEVCELCGQEGLRYHFEIRNELTNYFLNVGSHCILRFDLPVYEAGERLSTKKAKRLLGKLTQQMQLESCIKALEELAQQEDNKILTNAIIFYRKNKKLTPKMAFVVFWKLRKHNIDHHPSFFSINLKRQKCVEDLRSMDTSRVHFFWHALTPAQKQKAIELGHAAPKQ